MQYVAVQWLTLKDTTTGSIRIRAWWLDVTDDVTRLQQFRQVPMNTK